MGAAMVKLASRPSPKGSRLSAEGSEARVGVGKKKHMLGHSLLPALQAAAKSIEKPSEKARRKRAAKSAVLGAVEGMRASLDELLAEGEARAAAKTTDVGLTAKKRLKLIAEETVSA